VRRSSIVFVTAAWSVITISTFPTNGQELTRPSDWLDKLDREHDRLVSKGGHVHARGQVQAIDIGPATVTILSEEMESPDKSIWMPAMRMVFHVTNRRMLEGLRPGDKVEFEAARLRNAVMITKIRKVR
jgi:Cu/Ag efflux protein CusF